MHLGKTKGRSVSKVAFVYRAFEISLGLHCTFRRHYSTRYRAGESDAIEFEDLVTAEKRAVSVLILRYLQAYPRVYSRVNVYVAFSSVYHTQMFVFSGDHDAQCNAS